MNYKAKQALKCEATLFWNSSNLGSYVKDYNKRELLNPATHGTVPTARVPVARNK